MGRTRLPGRGDRVTETPRWGVEVMGSDCCSFIARSVKSSINCCPPWLMEFAEKRQWVSDGRKCYRDSAAVSIFSVAAGDIHRGRWSRIDGRLGGGLM
jgi:hypothetical protein